MLSSAISKYATRDLKRLKSVYVPLSPHMFAVESRSHSFH
jgi:hypothetical protein